MLQYQTIEPETLQLLKSLQSMPMFQGLRLVGGTALALQLGHRKSIDLDLFGTIEADSLEIRETLEESHTVSVVKESENIHIYLVDGVKVDFVNYRYSWIDEPVVASDITLASIKDISAMKSLTYFEDAESDPMPFMFEETDWEDVKTRIREAVIGL